MRILIKYKWKSSDLEQTLGLANNENTYLLLHNYSMSAFSE
jgi:hypothetical protein